MRLAVSGWRLAVGGWRLAVGGWRLAVGGWRLAVGGWRLAVGGWRLAVGGWPEGPRKLSPGFSLGGPNNKRVQPCKGEEKRKGADWRLSAKIALIISSLCRTPRRPYRAPLGHQAPGLRFLGPSRPQPHRQPQTANR